MSQAYGGTQRKLVLALDVGTTFSGVSYCILEPGTFPTIKGVTKFIGQEYHTESFSKVPTVLYYDRSGCPKAIGAEITASDIPERAAEGGWIKVEWFKMHLRPYPEKTPDITASLPPLPPGKTPVDVLADFLRYLFASACQYIMESERNANNLWNLLREHIDFILPHPNGWDGIQQMRIRKAAMLGGLVRDMNDGYCRISLVTEGEANLHYAIHNGVARSLLKPDDGIAIVDAGGGTIDISTYAQTSDPGKRKVFEEIAKPQCHITGSISVSLAAMSFLKVFLAESTFLEDIDTIVEVFDKTTKHFFRDDRGKQFIRFGSTRDNDPDFNIKFGQLALDGEDVAEFFNPSIQSVLTGLQLQEWRRRKVPLTLVVLLGGFSANEWFFGQLQTQLNDLGYTVVRPVSDINIGSALADGAVSFYLNRDVQSRISRMTFGTKGSIDYDPSNPEHQGRPTFTSVSNRRRIDNVFWVILNDNQSVGQEEEIRRTFYWEFKDASGLSRAKAYLYCCRGQTNDAAFMDDEPGRFSQVCIIEANLSRLAGSSMVESVYTKDGGRYFRLSYEVALLLGDTELKAKLVWKQEGEERCSPVEILYADDLLAEEPIDETNGPLSPPWLNNRFRYQIRVPRPGRNLTAEVELDSDDHDHFGGEIDSVFDDNEGKNDGDSTRGQFNNGEQTSN